MPICFDSNRSGHSVAKSWPLMFPSKRSVDLSVESTTDFPRFLGPDQNGIVSSTGQIDSLAFAEKSRIVWKQPIGAGWSGFAARNGNAVTMEQRGDQECVTCYEIATGTLKWIYSHPARHRDKMGLGRIGPRSTPTIHQAQCLRGWRSRQSCLPERCGWFCDLAKGSERDTRHQAGRSR